MRWFQVGSAALLLVACGGTAAHKAKGSPNAGGAAGESSATAGTSNVGLAGEGGAAGPSVGGVGGAAGGAAGAVAAGTAGAGAGEAGAGGQPAVACEGLDCLAGADFIYVPDREWQRPAAPVGITDELSEADYKPLSGPTWLAQFSSDALAVDLTPSTGGAPVHGTRDQERKDRAWFDLMLFAGGRFVVQVSTDELHAEYTTYGSGNPVIGSTRGLLQTP